MIFPSLLDSKGSYINLNEAAKKWLVGQERFEGHDSNPLNDPSICSEMVTDIHRELGIEYSYGGYLEDRSFLWRGSYLQAKETFIHLGVDVNAPPNTDVAIDFDGYVVRTDDDFPEEGGWGRRVIFHHFQKGFYVIFAHIIPQVAVGTMLKKGQIFAQIGQAPHNGNWYPHVHVQILTSAAYGRAQRDGFKTLDGYGPVTELNRLKEDFPNPMDFIEVGN